MVTIKYGYKNLMLLLLGCACVQTSIAATPQREALSFLKTIPGYFSNYVITVSGGPSFSKVGETQTFYLQSDLQNTYAANKKTQTIGTGELFFGLRHTLGEYLDGQLGLALAASSTAKASGQIWQDADAEYNNFIYSYHIKQSRLGLKAKLITRKNPFISFVQPYISGSVGLGFNRASNYQTAATIPEAVIGPNFSANTTQVLSYTLGVGIQTSIDGHWQVGLGYEFADWGQNHLGRAPYQTVNSGLLINHLYTNELQFSLSFIA